MSPDQKQRLIECLQRLEYVVGFCGDGANDCGALKSAHVGLSLSESEASLAAPFTASRKASKAEERGKNIAATLHLIREGRSAYCTSFSCFKFMALYSLIQFTTVGLLYTFTLNLSDVQYVFIDLGLILPLAFMIGRCRADYKAHTPEGPGALKDSQPRRHAHPPSQLTSKSVLIPLIGHVIIQCLFQCLLFVFTLSQASWADLPPISRTDSTTDTPAVTVLFLFSCYQYILAAFLFSLNRPYQRPIWKDRMFVATIIVLTLLSATLLAWPIPLKSSDSDRDAVLSFLCAHLELVFIPVDFKCILASWVLSYVFVSVLCHFYVFSLCIAAYKACARYRRGPHHKKKKIYKAFIEEEALCSIAAPPHHSLHKTV